VIIFLLLFFFPFNDPKTNDICFFVMRTTFQNFLGQWPNFFCLKKRGVEKNSLTNLWHPWDKVLSQNNVHVFTLDAFQYPSRLWIWNLENSLQLFFYNPREISFCSAQNVWIDTFKNVLIRWVNVEQTHKLLSGKKTER